MRYKPLLLALLLSFAAPSFAANDSTKEKTTAAKKNTQTKKATTSKEAAKTTDKKTASKAKEKADKKPAEKAKAEHAAGRPFSIGMITGASTAPECDGVLAAANAVHFRNPFQSDPSLRNSINAGNIAYQDMHLSHVEQQMRQGFYGDFDLAIIEVSGITKDGKLIPAMGIGHANEALKAAKKVIIEVNFTQNAKLEGMHDVVFDIGVPPHRKPIAITGPFDRVGSPYLE